MTPTIKPTSNTFVNIYSAQFETGKTDFYYMSAFFLESLKNLKEQASEDTLNAKPELHEYIAIDRKILRTAIKAQEHYLNTTLWGKIERAFQSFLGLFGVKSSLDRIKERINQLNIPNQSLNKADIKSKAQADMARSIAFRENATLCFPLGEDKSNPSTILIAKQNGDVYENRRDTASLKGQGSPLPGSRRLYTGKLHTTNDSKTIGILTNLTHIIRDDYKKCEIAEFQNANRKMNEEYSILEKFQNNNRVIKVYDTFSISIAGLDARFTIMDYHKSGDLSNFIGPEAKYKMTLIQKRDFIVSLLKAYEDLHNKGLIHRDGKLTNILVDNDLNPILIDFETCISDSDNARKQETVGSKRCWAPEYVAATLKGMEEYGIAKRNQTGTNSDPCANIAKHICAATTKAMDTWAVGLVIFQLMFEEDLIKTTLGFGNLPESESNLQKILSENLPKFILAMSSKEKPAGEIEDWQEIWGKIQESSEIWKQIILPMLSADPAQRPSMRELHQELQNLEEPLITA